MQFVHQALIGGFLLAILPVLIHLINMMRHKRVQWAAMEFLLASYKKHRTWVWLKQLILLLSRMAILRLALIVGFMRPSSLGKFLQKQRDLRPELGLQFQCAIAVRQQF